MWGVIKGGKGRVRGAGSISGVASRRARLGSTLRGELRGVEIHHSPAARGVM